MAKRKDLEDAGAKCERIATNLTLCTTRSGEEYWCTDEGTCIVAPKKLGPDALTDVIRGEVPRAPGAMLGGIAHTEVVRGGVIPRSPGPLSNTTFSARVVRRAGEATETPMMRRPAASRIIIPREPSAWHRRRRRTRIEYGGCLLLWGRFVPWEHSESLAQTALPWQAPPSSRSRTQIVQQRCGVGPRLRSRMLRTPRHRAMSRSARASRRATAPWASDWSQR